MRLIQVCLADHASAQTQQVEQLIASLAERGIKQQLVCKAGSALHKRLSPKRSLHLVPINNRLQGHFKVPKTGLVHAHDLEAVKWAQWQQRLRATPWLLSWRSLDPQSTELLTASRLKGSQAVLVSSQAAELALREKTSQPIKRIPDAALSLATNPLLMTQLRSRYQGRFVIGHWGRIDRQAGGQQHLIMCAERMQAEYPNMIFVILGKGPDYEYLKEEYKDRSNLDWIGEPEHLGDYFSIMNLYIDPAHHADTCTGILQAMNFHIPVISSRISGFSELISHRSNGLLFKRGDLKSLEEMIKVLYNSTQLRTRLSRDAKQALKDFTPEQIALKHLAVYQAIIKSLKGKSG